MTETDTPEKQIPAWLSWIGIAFIVIGLLAILVPAAATIAAELMLAVMLIFWGVLGIAAAFAMREEEGWLAPAGFFALLLLVGLIFLFYPAVGIHTMTFLATISFAIEGVVSIMFAFRLRKEAEPGWFWVFLSGVAALVVAGVVISTWPLSAAWFVGLLVGINFLTTGIALYLFARAAANAVKE